MRSWSPCWIQWLPTGGSGKSYTKTDRRSLLPPRPLRVSRWRARTECRRLLKSLCATPWPGGFSAAWRTCFRGHIHLSFRLRQSWSVDCIDWTRTRTWKCAWQQRNRRLKDGVGRRTWPSTLREEPALLGLDPWTWGLSAPLVLSWGDAVVKASLTLLYVWLFSVKSTSLLCSLSWSRPLCQTVPGIQICLLGVLFLIRLFLRDALGHWSHLPVGWAPPPPTPGPYEHQLTPVFPKSPQ